VNSCVLNRLTREHGDGAANDVQNPWGQTGQSFEIAPRSGAGRRSEDIGAELAVPAGSIQKADILTAGRAYAAGAWQVHAQGEAQSTWWWSSQTPNTTNGAKSAKSANTTIAIFQLDFTSAQYDHIHCVSRSAGIVTGWRSSGAAELHAERALPLAGTAPAPYTGATETGAVA
jgi:hypothetical protein